MNQKPQGVNYLVMAIKVIISLAALVFMVHYFSAKSDIIISSMPLILSLLEHQWLAPFLVLFTGLNWLLESKKWQLLIKQEESITLFASLKAVLSGVTIGLFTPNRIGEYAGRIWFVKNKVHAISSTVIGNICQLAVTLVFGMLSLLFFTPSKKMLLHIINAKLIFPVFLAILVFLLLYRFRISIWRWLSNKNINSLTTLVNSACGFNLPIIFQTLLLSVIRYVSFVLPFALVLAYFYQSALLPFLWIVPLTYFIQTFIPSFAIAEIGVRVASIGYIMESIQINPEPAIIASIFIWILNVMLPSFIGIIFIWQTKITPA